jgi:hypothetical protein
MFIAGPLAAGASDVTPPRDVQLRIAPVITAYRAMTNQGETTATREALDSALAAVLDDDSAAGDEALAVLLGFYVGEHSGEDISCELISRGSRVLAYLQKYDASRAMIPILSGPMPDRVSTEYSVLAKRIRSGERCSREP